MALRDPRNPHKRTDPRAVGSLFRGHGQDCCLVQNRPRSSGRSPERGDPEKVAIPRSDAAQIALDITAILAGGSSDAESWAFRRFIQLADNLAAEGGDIRVALTLAEPAPTGSEHWDTAIAAVCEYRLNADSLLIADWIRARTGNPSAPWAPGTSNYDIPVAISQVPAEFLIRGILVEAATLESVKLRFPRLL